MPEEEKSPEIFQAAVVKKGNQVLLAKAEKNGLWTLPKGRQHLFDSIEETIREVTGVTIKLTEELIHIDQDIQPPDHDQRTFYHLASYLEGKARGRPRHGYLRTRFMAPNRVKELIRLDKLDPLTQKVLTKAQIMSRGRGN